MVTAHNCWKFVLFLLLCRVDRIGSLLIIIDVVIPFQVVLVVVVVIVIASPPTPPEEWRAEMGKGGSGLGGNHLALSYTHCHGVRGQAE